MNVDELLIVNYSKFIYNYEQIMFIYKQSLQWLLQIVFIRNSIDSRKISLTKQMRKIIWFNEQIYLKLKF